MNHPKWRQLPVCSWCFDPILNPKQKFCGLVCTQAAKDWDNSRLWNKFAESKNKGHYEPNVLEDDAEYPIDGYPI